MAGAGSRTKTVSYPIPRLPVLDWTIFEGTKSSPTPCLLSLPNVTFTTSGRAAILLALEMLPLSPGDKVLVPTYHCPTMIAPIVALGGQVVFYPLSELGAPRLDWLSELDLSGVRAILVAHFFGLPQNLQVVRQWCDQRNVRLIEDCAHSLFGISDHRPIGSWGDLAIASLTKFLPVPEGGTLVNNSIRVPVPQLTTPRIYSQIKAAIDIVHTGVNHGRLRGLGLIVKTIFKMLDVLRKKNLTKKLAEQRLEAISQSDGFTIDIELSHQALTKACRWAADNVPRGRIVSRRRENYDFLAQQLYGLSGLRPLRPNLPENCAPYVFPLWVERPDPGYAQLRQLEFPVSRWDRLWPTTPAIEGDSGTVWSVHVLQLACHQDLSTTELQEMVDTLKKVYGVEDLEFKV